MLRHQSLLSRHLLALGLSTVTAGLAFAGTDADTKPSGAHAGNAERTFAQVQPVPPSAAAPVAATPPALPPPMPFEEALLAAANALFGKAQFPDGTPAPTTLVVDPLIDGMTGIQSNTTRAMERRMVELVKASYPRFNVEPFTTATVAKQPVVLIGTFTPINLAGKADGERDAFRVCLALLDLRSGLIVSKGFARAKPEGIEHAPVAYYNDSPVWTNDPSTLAYIRSCQGTKAGDQINQAYADRVLAAAFLSDAIIAYNDRRYRDALDLYKTVQKTPGGDQLRTYNGLYLANLKLKRTADASAAFEKVVDFGLQNNRLAVKFLFRPGSTQLWSDSKSPTPYQMWLKTIAAKVSGRGACLELVGHSSPTGPEPINLRLSGLRAEFVKDRLTELSPDLGKRMIAHGAGSKEPLVGTGKDNASDALDRRVEFKTIGNC